MTNKLNEQMQKFPETDTDWTEQDWKKFLEILVDNNLMSYEEICASVLGLINPPQVGTSIASNKSFQSHYPKRETWKHTRNWLYNQSGKCVDCNTRFDLQADHIIPREEIGSKADYIDNLALRCRRCNVAKRPSHKNAKKTFLTSESALMWLLLTKQPHTYQDYQDLCRKYGLTMASVRFQESWAMAHWLQKEGLYTIDPSSKY